MTNRDETPASSSDLIRQARDQFYGRGADRETPPTATVPVRRPDRERLDTTVVAEDSPRSVAVDSPATPADWRAAEPLPHDRPPARHTRSRIVRILGRFMVPALIAAGFAIYSAIDDTKPVDSLSVGDCLLEPGGTEITTVELKGCDEPHVYEVFSLVQDGSVPDTAYPGDDAVSETIFNRCLARYEPYVGTTFDRSAHWISVIYPTEESWGDGDRTGTCLVYQGDAAGEPVTRTQSLRGAEA